MSRRILLGLLLLLVPRQLQAQEPLVEKVKTSIDRGVKFLRENQQPGGGWEIEVANVQYPGGGTCLALLALLNSGMPAKHPDIQRGLKYLRGLEPTKTYTRGLQTMVFAEAGFPEDLGRIQDNVKWLERAAVYNQGNLIGWSYGAGGSSTADNSNTQYALLGLWAGRQAGVKLPKPFWESVRTFYERTQNEDGGWGYSAKGLFSGGLSLLTMTEAGVCGLLMAQMELALNAENLQPDGSAPNCGKYADLESLQRGLNWISGPNEDRLQFDPPNRIFYNIYGIERVGRLSGLRFLGRHDWYREGCEYLVRTQRDNGSWWVRSGWDSWPIVSTSFSLLFLSKGRTPILMSKVVHTNGWPRPASDNDWNNDRNDLRHLVEFTQKELFKIPLGWQNLDLMRSAEPRQGAALTDEDLAHVVSEMLQSPILYITGHKSPLTRFTPLERELLKRYIENGGFILAEACCNSANFDQGFHALAAQLWPDNPLEPLDAKHPVWSVHFPVTPGDPYRLKGINLGCKTVVIYSPQDLSCQWESNLQTTARGDRAFKLGTNIIAYATGLEPPKPRLSSTDVVSSRDDGPAQIPRGFLKVGQIKHSGDWQPAPRAMRNLMDHLRRYAGVDVSLKTDEIQMVSPKIIDYKFLYMHGRAEFQFPKEQLKNLRFNLESGGLLLADACCGKEAFDRSFRKMVKDLFPDQPLTLVPAQDELFGKELNGLTLNELTIRGQREAAQGFRAMQPHLEGIKVNDRWVVLYSKYDLGCALEKHRSAECLGYDHDSATRLAGAAVLYTLKP